MWDVGVINTIVFMNFVQREKVNKSNYIFFILAILFSVRCMCQMVDLHVALHSTVTALWNAGILE